MEIILDFELKRTPEKIVNRRFIHSKVNLEYDGSGKKVSRISCLLDLEEFENDESKRLKRFIDIIDELIKKEES